jgi:hypothetical protein
MMASSMIALPAVRAVIFGRRGWDPEEQGRQGLQNCHGDLLIRPMMGARTILSTVRARVVA